MQKLLRNPKARIAVLAVLVVGGLWYLLRRQSGLAAATSSAPVAPNAPADVGGPTSPPITLGNGTVPVFDPGFLPGPLETFPTFTIRDPSDSGGASDPTGTPKTGGDGSPAAPGNAVVRPRTPSPRFAPVFHTIHPPGHGAGSPQPPTSNVIVFPILHPPSPTGAQPPPRDQSPHGPLTGIAPGLLPIPGRITTPSGAIVITPPAVVPPVAPPEHPHSPIFPVLPIHAAPSGRRFEPV